ncbi:hypothetical protein SH1V18_03950 [Vallitalea longa]|uniref:N-acetyltransferase domain-containing protein n=1 Tax=Vallitalea longa TaxID=2936439 RepID=A0A9W6DDC4_9FIRM|nr:GNAT family N-acetyltransferase [Vallitalea longa]GKX27915.1 hypothetical protein SH1V18_03950 [Vallitalea longa]
MLINVSLGKRTREHVKIYWDKIQDEETQKMFPFSIESLEESLKLFEKSLEDEASSYGRVIYHDDKYVGDIWCYCIDETDEKMAMLSIVIFEKTVWGQGIGSQAIKMFIKEIFDKYSIDKIGAFTYAYNDRSINLLEKSGFNRIETFVEDGIESIYLELSR